MNYSSSAIRELLDLFESSQLASLHVKTDEFEVTLSTETASRDVAGAAISGTGHTTAPVELPPHGTPSTPSPPRDAGPSAPVAGEAAPTEKKTVTIVAPTVGIFYRAPRPDQAPYIELGSHVDPDSTVGLIEAMKVFTAVTADVAGTVREIVADNNDFVEHGQILIEVEPDDAGASQ